MRGTDISGAFNSKRTNSNRRGQTLLAAAALLGSLGFPLVPSAAAVGSPTGWVVSTPIETGAGDAYNAQVAVDGDGNAVAVWTQKGASWYSIWANRYVAGSGWGAAALIGVEGVGDAINPQVAADLGGNAFAVWAQEDVSVHNIWANRYVAGWGWGTAALIETDDTGTAFDPQVAVDGIGNAFAVWAQSDGSRVNIWANRYLAGSGWGTAVLIETDNTDSAYYPQVAVDGGGNAVTVWQQSDGSRVNIWANRYRAGGGWQTASVVEKNDTGDAARPQVAVDGNGNAFAVWEQSDGSRFNIYSNRYRAGGSWGTPSLIETNNAGSAFAAQVAVDGGGDAVAVWYQDDGVRTNIWANEYLAASGWGTAHLIETDDSGPADEPQVAVDGNGNAIATWSQYGGGHYHIWASRYVAGSGWATAPPRATDDAGDAYLPQVAFDGSANAVAVWQHFDGARVVIESNRFVQPDTTAPNIILSAPSDGAVTNRTPLSLFGTAVGAKSVFVNGYAVTVASNGSFGLSLALSNGMNPITITAIDASGNSAIRWLNVTFDDPAAARLAQLEAQNAALEARLSLANSSLWQALAGTDASVVAALAAQNASIAAALAGEDASLLGGLAAQNSSLLQTIASLNSSFLASLAAQNATLWTKLTADNGALWTALNASSGGGGANRDAAIAASQADAAAARSAAASATMIGTIGLLAGIAGVGLGILGMRSGRKGGGTPPPPTGQPPAATSPATGPDQTKP